MFILLKSNPYYSQFIAFRSRFFILINGDHLLKPAIEYLGSYTSDQKQFFDRCKITISAFIRFGKREIILIFSAICTVKVIFVTPIHNGIYDDIFVGIFNFKIVQHHLQQGIAGLVQVNLSAFVFSFHLELTISKGDRGDIGIDSPPDILVVPLCHQESSPPGEQIH